MRKISINNILGSIITFYGVCDFLARLKGESWLASSIAKLEGGVEQALVAIIALTILLIIQALFIDEVSEMLWERADERRFPYYNLVFLLAGYGAGVWLTIPVCSLAGGNEYVSRYIVLLIFFVFSLRRNMPAKSWWAYEDKVQFLYKVAAAAILGVFMYLFGLI